MGTFRVHYHIVRIDAVSLGQGRSESATTLRPFPPIQRRAERFARNGERRFIEQSQAAQVQHYFRYAASHEYSDGRMADRAVGKSINQTWYPAIDGDPVSHRWPWQSSGVGNCWNM